MENLNNNNQEQSLSQIDQANEEEKRKELALEKGNKKPIHDGHSNISKMYWIKDDGTTIPASEVLKGKTPEELDLMIDELYTRLKILKKIDDLRGQLRRLEKEQDGLAHQGDKTALYGNIMNQLEIYDSIDILKSNL